ncbi:MAG: hypothetical protein MUC86_11400 [Burkholderiaceae bacterium]|nr:hypothetical protein [Burkholderiaceae bacterium]
MPLTLLDSVTQVAAAHAGHVVITGSHGGASVVPYARAVPALLYVFNDAGIGKDRAGIASLDLLQADGIAACAVAHTSARIGDAQDAWLQGVVSAVNAQAAALGVGIGDLLREAVAPVLRGR